MNDDRFNQDSPGGRVGGVTPGRVLNGNTENLLAGFVKRVYLMDLESGLGGQGGSAPPHSARATTDFQPPPLLQPVPFFSSSPHRAARTDAPIFRQAPLKACAAFKRASAFDRSTTWRIAST